MLKNDIFPSQFPRARTAAPPLSGGLMWRAAAVKLNWPTEGDSCRHTSFSRSQTLKVRSFPTDRRRLSEKESFRIHDLILELVCKVFSGFITLQKLRSENGWVVSVQGGLVFDYTLNCLKLEWLLLSAGCHCCSARCHKLEYFLSLLMSSVCYEHSGYRAKFMASPILANILIWFERR